MNRITRLSDRKIMVSRHLGGRLTLAAGTIDFSGKERPDEAIAAGLKVVVVVSGSSTIRLARRDPVRLSAPVSLVVFTERSIERDQIFAAGTTYRYALVDIEPSFVRDEMGIDMSTLCPPGIDGFAIAVRRANSIERALASQILASPVGAEHNLSRLAKALELVSTMLSSLKRPEGSCGSGRFAAAEVESLHRARGILVRSLASPPDQASLASEVGLNTRRLGEGFRAVFGATPYAFLQEERLQEGYRQLVAGATSVSTVSYAVGYSPAHFATLFSRRFGIPPSNLLAAKAASIETTDRSFERR